MAEYKDYRDVLRDLHEIYGCTSWITIGELARLERADNRTVRKRYGIPSGVNGIDTTILAKRKCAMTIGG